MFSTESLIDELEKIAAHKSRHGSVPIRAANLASKDVIDKRGKTTTKLAATPIEALMTPAGKTIALMAGGYALGKGVEQGVDDWKLGRAIRKQQMQ